MAKKKITIRDRNDEASIYNDDMIELPEDFGVIVPNAIELHDDGSIQLGRMRMTAIGLQIEGAISEEEYIAFGEAVVQLNTAYQWIVGDYLAYGEDANYGDAKRIATMLHRDPTTLWNWTSICRRVEYSRRREDLSFSHHEVVASLPDVDQEHWLNIASEKGWSSKRLRDEIDGPAQKPNARSSRIPTSLFRFRKTFTPQQYKRMTVTERMELRQTLEEMLTQINDWDTN